MQRDKVLFATAGVLALVAVLYFGSRWLSSPKVPSVEELAHVALSGTPEQSQTAALKLITLGKPALPHLRQVLAESKTPEVRAAMIQGLVQSYDLPSMPAFLDGLSDESPLVRARSAAAVRVFIINGVYSPNDPPEKREAAIKFCRKAWGRMLQWPHIQKRLAEESAN